MHIVIICFLSNRKMKAAKAPKPKPNHAFLKVKLKQYN
jgi:hypothetical protein